MDELEREFEKRGPWVTSFTINGKKYGGKKSWDGDKRPIWFFEAFPNVKRVLELSTLEGALTIELAKRAEKVMAIEGRASNIEKAKFVQGLLGITNVEFIQADLETADLKQLVSGIDAVFCTGLLYHLQNPVDLIRRAREVADKIFIQTKYASDFKLEKAFESRLTPAVNGKFFRDNPQRPQCGLVSRVFWLDLPSLISAVVEYFPIIKIIAHHPTHPEGAKINLVAWS